MNSLTPHIAVTGAAGQVGRELVALGGTPLTRRTLDLASSPEALREVALRCFAGKDAVINCAAWTDVDGAEDPANRATVEAVNATAPGVLAEAAAQFGAHFIHVSTDYVFPVTPPADGREWAPDDPTDPLNVYGATKATGEQAVLAHGGTVVRTAWVWSGPHVPGRDFVATMAGLAERGVDPKVVDDQTGRPTFAADLADGLWELSQKEGPLPGVLHYTNSGDPVTWCGLAREVFRLLGHDPERVTPCGSDEWPAPAARPEWSVMDLAPWRETVGEPPTWRTALARGLG